MVEVEKIREDLNSIVKSINLKKEVNKKYERKVCLLRLFNDEVIEIRDEQNLWSLFSSYRNCGEENFIKEKKLMDDYKINDEGEKVSKYTCIYYELVDGTSFRIFPEFIQTKIIDNYYNLYKKQNSNKKEVKV